MTQLLNLIFYLKMKDEDAKVYFGRPDVKAVFERKLLDFGIPPEVER